MSPDEIEHWFAEADWRYLLSDAAPRESRSFREKEREARLNQTLEVSLSRTGALQFPAGFISGQKVLLNLRQLILPVREITDFDRLPIPFRAIATDLQTGEKIVLGSGSLADAMRASMAVPGVFTPHELDGHLAGGRPADFESAGGNGARDGSADCDRGGCGPEFREGGGGPGLADRGGESDARYFDSTRDGGANPDADGARCLHSAAIAGRDLVRFRWVDGKYSGGLCRRDGESAGAAPAGGARGTIQPSGGTASGAARDGFADHVSGVSGSQGLQRATLENEISFAPGDRIERYQLERLLAGREEFRDSEIADFRVVEAGGEYGLRIETRARSRGPNYVSLGVDFNYTTAGETDANLLLSFRMTELNRLGAEWETFLSVGDLTRVFSEWYQPIDRARRLFLAADFLYANEFINALDGTETRRAFRRQELLGGLDAGLRLGRWGEWRVGYSGGASRIGRTLNLPPGVSGWSERSELRTALTLDTLDRANFPTKGFFGKAVATVSREELGAAASYQRLDAEIYKPITFGPNTIVPRLVAGVKLGGNDLPLYDQRSLGGFLELSGFSRRGLYDQNAGVAALIYDRELAKLPAALGGGVYAGISLEAGEVWGELSDFELGHLKFGGSIFLGADTVVGPLYLGLGGNSESEVAVYLQLSPVLRTERRPR